MQTRLILASRSPRRIEALAALGLTFETIPSQVEASLPAPVHPADPVPVALAKAQDIAGRHPDAIVLGGDTIVVVDGQALGKPADAAEARAMLRALRGREHVVRTAVAVVAGRRSESAEVACPLLMRAYADDEIERYDATGEPLDCAGAYDVHRLGGALVAEVRGCFSTVVGLPIVQAAAMLERAGVRVPNDPAAVCSRLYGRTCLAAHAATAGACRAKVRSSE